MCAIPCLENCNAIAMVAPQMSWHFGLHDEDSFQRLELLRPSMANNRYYHELHLLFFVKVKVHECKRVQIGSSSFVCVNSALLFGTFKKYKLYGLRHPWIEIENLHTQKDNPIVKKVTSKFSPVEKKSILFWSSCNKQKITSAKPKLWAAI